MAIPLVALFAVGWALFTVIAAEAAFAAKTTARLIVLALLAILCAILSFSTATRHAERWLDYLTPTVRTAHELERK